MPAIRSRATRFALLLLTLCCAFAAPAAAAPPWMSASVFALQVSFDECRSRVASALAAEGYGGTRDFGNGWLGFTATHSASVGCIHGDGETVVVITVASEGDNTAQRDRLGALLRKSAAGAEGRYVAVERGAEGNVVVRWREMPGNENDWISVQPAGAADDSYGATWTYTAGKREGTYDAGKLAPGDYEVRVYFNWPDGGFTVQERVRFRVD